MDRFGNFCYMLFNKAYLIGIPVSRTTTVRKGPILRQTIKLYSILNPEDSLSHTNVGPLSGIRVVDMTRILAGPYCTMILGDLGAEIIKVEKPGTGDDTRSWVPPSINGQSCYFISVNRNKKSLALDLKKGRSVIEKLVEKSDILVENFVPNTLEKLGLGYDHLKKINPRLIFCSITGYGQSGPYIHRGGYDVIAASLGGLLHITGPRDGEPCKVGVAMTDIATGLYAHGAIMAALIQRNSTGVGQRIDCNLLSTQLACLVHLGSNYINAGMDSQRWGTAHESIVPYQAFQTKDGRWITIGAGNNELFFELCDTIGQPELKKDKRFGTNSSHVENREALVSLISDAIKQKDCTEWLKCFNKCKFPHGPVNSIQEAFRDPQVQHNKVVQELGGFKIISPAVSYSLAENSPRCPPPLLGEHTRNILVDTLKLSKSEVDQLFDSKAVE